MLKLLFGLIFSLGFLSAAAQIRKNNSGLRSFDLIIDRPGSEADTGILLIEIRSGTDIGSINGLKVLRQFNQNHFVVRTDRSLKDKVIMQQPANSLWKASDNLIQEISRAGTRSIDVVLVVKSGKASKLKLPATGQHKVSGQQIFLKTNVNELKVLLDDPMIEFAELQRSAKEETLINNLDLAANQVSRIKSRFPLLNGKGITVSLKEDRFNSADLDLLGRTKNSTTQSADVSSHATLMATLVGGSGNSFIKGLGAAPAVSLTSSDYKNLSPDDISQLRTLDVSVQNHSYGTGIENYYGLEAAEYDRQVYLADTLTHVFSSGNSGTAAPFAGVYSGISNFSNLTGTFKQAKNVLVVGGTNNENVVESLSSAGPAYDGRIKPEIVAAGEDGTSGAAALTSGVVSLLQQEFKAKTGRQPSSALIRNVIINSSDDIGRPNPDYKTGFGKLNAYEAVQTIKEDRFLNSSVSSAQVRIFPLTVNSNEQLKITLTWNDIAADLNAPTALINDLDIWLEDPSGTKIRPWVLNAYPNVDSLTKNAVRQRDSLNNVEQLSWNGAPGVYNIHVEGKRVTGEQNFYLSYSMKQSGKFEWTYPLSGDQLFAAEDNYLRWDNTIEGGNGIISISYDKGLTWAQIAAAPVATGYVKWKSPDLFSEATLKMSINGEDFISPVFSVSKPLSLNVGYNCTDGILLTWNGNRTAKAYNLYTIKNNILQLLKTTSDTSVLVKRNEISSDYYAVSPVHTTGFEGLKSLTINISAQGVGCYFKSLLADINARNNISLSLTLGTTVGLKSIRWEKLTGRDSYSIIGTTNLTSASAIYGFEDLAPKQGIQYYRAILETLDGRQLISDLASVIYLNPYDFTLFPNPVNRMFTVLSGSTETFEMKIYNSSGQTVRTELLNNIIQTFNIEALNNGMYVCVIRLNGRSVYRTKFIKI